MINPIRSSAKFIYSSSLSAIEFLNKNVVFKITTLFSTIRDKIFSNNNINPINSPVGKQSSFIYPCINNFKLTPSESERIREFNLNTNLKNIEIVRDYKPLFDRIAQSH